MANQLCLQCFKLKGDYEVCPYCGYDETTQPRAGYQLPAGTVLHGRYITGVSIGIGGFGITYKAFDTVLGIIVAIKEFYPAGLVSRGEKETKVGIFSGEKENEFKCQLARFLEEARNLAMFSREKDIVNVYDYFEENQTAYIIMEYVDAPLLKERLKEGRLSQEEATGCILALLEALAKLHARGILHRDVSPDNLFLTGEGIVKLFDFGAAKLEGTEPMSTAVVKAGYTPPEQYTANSGQSPALDVYAAGAVLYEMLTGIKPLDAPERALKDELKTPRELGVPVEDWLERILFKAMAMEPAKRFATAEAFHDAILSKKTGFLQKGFLRKLWPAK